MTERFLSLKEVGERLGVKNPAAKGYNLPEPDALIGATRGWLPETIDRWNAARPGRGVGGGRPRKHPEEEAKAPGRSSASAGAILLAGWRLSDAVGFVPLEGFLHVFVSKGFADCHGCLLHE